MAALSGQLYEYRGAVTPAAPKATVATSLLPPMIAFVLFSGVTWSLLNGPAKSSAEPCAEIRCAAPAAPLPSVRGAPLRVVVYDPALEPLKIVPWDAQAQSGPEAPVREKPPAPAWIRLTAAEDVGRGTCLMVGGHRLVCMIFPRSDAGSGGSHEG